MLMCFLTSSHLLPTCHLLATSIGGFCYDYICLVGQELNQKKFDHFEGRNGSQYTMIETGSEQPCWKLQSSVLLCSVSTHFADRNHGFEPRFLEWWGLVTLLFPRGKQCWRLGSLPAELWDKAFQALTAVTNKKKMWLFLSVLIFVACIMFPGM